MSRRLRSQVQVIVPRLADLPEYRDVEAWLLFEGPSPGVYSYDPCGKFARAYQDYDQARRDYARYQDCGLIELMNRPLPEDYTWCVVTEGFQVGVYPDRYILITHSIDTLLIHIHNHPKDLRKRLLGSLKGRKGVSNN
ncbi:hypothetical protein PM082_019265 [Marasmius tenuissimus]|nr:hypothetical protein PM082_019265 [Marasmius tenuissimus]